MQHNSPLPKQFLNDRSELNKTSQNVYVSKIAPWDVQVNESNFEKIAWSIVNLTHKLEYQDFFCRNFSSQRTCISNSTALH